MASSRGKTVLLDRMRDDAEAGGIHTLRIEAPENRSLPAILAPQLALRGFGGIELAEHVQLWRRRKIE